MYEEQAPDGAQRPLFDLPDARPVPEKPAGIGQLSTPTGPLPEPAETEPPTPRRPSRPRWRPPAGLSAKGRFDYLLQRLRDGADTPGPLPADGTLYAPIYQLKVTLKVLRPAIWRRIHVQSNVTLARLHRIVQNIMGWENYHLYEFGIDGHEFSEGEDLHSSGFLDARGRRLVEMDLAPGSRFDYVYDFGDGWQHTILLEKVLAADPEMRYPACLAGKRACPPEDCGGYPGYVRLLEAIADFQDPEHEAMLQWSGGEFDAEQFDPERVNLDLLRSFPRAATSPRDRRLAWKAIAQIVDAPKKARNAAGGRPRGMSNIIRLNDRFQSSEED